MLGAVAAAAKPEARFGAGNSATSAAAPLAIANPEAGAGRDGAAPAKPPMRLGAGKSAKSITSPALPPPGGVLTGTGGGLPAPAVDGIDGIAGTEGRAPAVVGTLGLGSMPGLAGSAGFGAKAGIRPGKPDPTTVALVGKTTLALQLSQSAYFAPGARSASEKTFAVPHAVQVASIIG